MGVGDLSFSAVASLRSIDTWIATINSNMGGAGRVGFKAQRVKFDGGVTQSLRPSVSPTLGVQVAEQSLGVVQTTLDFSQGAIAASTDFTHFALQNGGSTTPMFMLNTAADGSGDTYYTRDGEFHFDTTAGGAGGPFLVNSTGLFVMSQDGDAISGFDDVDGIPGEINAAGTADEDVVNGNIALERFRIQDVQNPQLELRFSRFGSTIFEAAPTANVGNAGTAIGTLGVFQPNADGNFLSGRVIPNSLEASNSNLTALVPELSLAQKMYTAITKVIQVSFSNIDSALGLIR